MHVDTLAMNALSLPSLLPFKFSVNDSIGRVELLSSFPSCGSPSKTRTKCPCCNHVTSAIDCPRVYKYNLLKRLFVVEAFRMCGTLAGVGRFLVRLGIPSFAACRLCVANTFVRSRQGQLKLSLFSFRFYVLSCAAFSRTAPSISTWTTTVKWTGPLPTSSSRAAPSSTSPPTPRQVIESFG